MRTITISLSAAAVLAGGLAATWATVLTQPAPASRALTCAQPVNPTVRQIVNDVCSKFGP